MADSNHFRLRRLLAGHVRQFAHAQALLAPAPERAGAPVRAVRRPTISRAAEQAASASAGRIGIIGVRRALVVADAAQLAKHADVAAEQQRDEQHTDDAGDLQQLGDFVVGHRAVRRVPYTCGTVVHGFITRRRFVGVGFCVSLIMMLRGPSAHAILSDEPA